MPDFNSSINGLSRTFMCFIPALQIIMFSVFALSCLTAAWRVLFHSYTELLYPWLFREKMVYVLPLLYCLYINTCIYCTYHINYYTTLQKRKKKKISHFTFRVCYNYMLYISSWCSPPGIQVEINMERARILGKKKIQSIFLLAQNEFFGAVMVQLSNSHTFHSTNSHI